jgi:hypothetical protein
MAKFLNTSGTNFFLEELIKNAKERLILINLSSMKYFSFLASFGKLAYLDLSNKPL